MTHDSEILTLLRQLDQKFGGLDAKVDGLDAKVDGLDGKFEGLDEKVDGLDAKIDHIDQEHGRALELLRQDVTLMRGTLNGQTNTLHILLQDTRLLRAAVNDIASDNVTPGEVAVLHEDMSRLQQAVSELQGRLDIFEGRDQR